MKEVWKDLIYQGNNYGDKFEVANTGKIRNKNTGTVLKLNVVGGGYLAVCVSLGNRGNVQLFKLHRALMETFVSNEDVTLIINHIDGNKLNNNLENLEWCTHSRNTQHAFDMGLIVAPKGWNHIRSKLTPEDVNFIRTNYKSRDTLYGARALGRKFNIDHMQILKVVNNITYNM